MNSGLEKTKKNRVLMLLAISYLLLVIGLDARAVELPNPVGTADFKIIVGRMIQVLTGGAGVVALLMFVYGGFQWLTIEFAAILIGGRFKAKEGGGLGTTAICFDAGAGCPEGWDDYTPPDGETPCTSAQVYCARK